MLFWQRDLETLAGDQGDFSQLVASTTGQGDCHCWELTFGCSYCDPGGIVIVVVLDEGIGDFGRR